MVTIGLIGCGGMGAMHISCYLAMQEKVRVIAIAEGNTVRARPYAERAGAVLYASAEELLENETPDIIDICLPTFLHAKYASMAMQKGCAVFVEKPVCLLPEEAEQLLQLQKETGATVQVGHVVRFSGAYRLLRDMTKKYGRVCFGAFHRLSFRPTWAGGNLCDYRKSGTVALDMHIHDIDFIRYLMGGDPEELQAMAVRDSAGVIQQIFATYRYGDSVITAEGGWDFPQTFPFTAGYRVKLEGATAVFDGTLLRVYTEDGEVLEPEIPKAFSGKADCGINITDMDDYYAELAYFVDCIAHGKTPEIAPLSEGVAAARLAWREIEMVGGAKIGE